MWEQNVETQEETSKRILCTSQLDLWPNRTNQNLTEGSTLGTVSHFIRIMGENGVKSLPDIKSWEKLFDYLKRVWTHFQSPRMKICTDAEVQLFPQGEPLASESNRLFSFYSFLSAGQLRAWLTIVEDGPGDERQLRVMLCLAGVERSSLPAHDAADNKRVRVKRRVVGWQREQFSAWISASFT